MYEGFSFYILEAFTQNDEICRQLFHSIRVAFFLSFSPKVNENDGDRFNPSQLGSATLASALSPDEALVVFRELQKARRCFVLENELHIVYQVSFGNAFT